MEHRDKDLRDCATAYDCREALPELSAWMSDDALKDHAYVRHADVPEQVWAQLVTWKQLVSEEQAEAIDETVNALGIGREQSPAGEAHPLPPEW